MLGTNYCYIDILINIHTFFLFMYRISMCLIQTLTLSYVVFETEILPPF
jgi:hypothetical protein